PNAHLVCVGHSGSGKTQTLKAIAHALGEAYAGRIRVIVIDFHGDQEVRGEECYALHRSSPHGINPLRPSLDPEGGGPGLQALALVASCSRPLALGPKQEGVLLQALKEVYARAGIEEGDVGSWARPAPTFASLEKVID